MSRGLWDERNLKHAVNAVLQCGMSKKRASVVYKIPRATLIRHVDGANKGRGVEKRLGRPQLLSEEEELELSTLIQDMESRLYGLTEFDIKKIVYSYCCKKRIKTQFNDENKVAGRVWMRGFMKRHPELSFRKPEAVSIQRAIGFNAQKVGRFYNLLEETVYKETGERKVPACNIFNVDESGFTIVQKPCRIIAKKGKKFVGCLTSAEKGRTITAVCCASATGRYVSPMLIFPRARMKPNLMDHCVPGAVGTCTKTGWINEQVFSEWFDHFMKEVQPKTHQEPILLIFDGHASHTRNLDVIQKARENNVILLCLPSHTSHRLQPLDVSFFKSLKSKYDEQVRLWLRNHVGRALAEDRVAEIFGIAYQEAASVKNAVSGFRRAGIEPFNRDTYAEQDYAGALMTEKPISDNEDTEARAENDGSDEEPDMTATPDAAGTAEEEAVLETPQKSSDVGSDTQKQGQQCSASAVEVCPTEEAAAVLEASQKNSDVGSDTQNNDNNVAHQPAATFQEFVEAQKNTETPRRKTRKVAHAKILTTSPYKRNLEAEKETQEKRQEKVAGKKRKLVQKETNKKSSGTKRSANKSKDDTPCGTCREKFCDDNSGSKWTQCQQCVRWFHNACQGLPEKPQRTFVCIECSD